MHNVAIVDIAERCGDLGAKLGHLSRIERPVRNPLDERRPIDQLHDQIGTRPRSVRRVHSRIEDGDEVDVPQRSENSDLSLGPTLYLPTGWENLDSNAPVQQLILCTENVRHAAATQQRSHSIATGDEPASARPIFGRTLSSAGYSTRSLLLVSRLQA